VILINLLPHREERRKQRKRAFFIGLGVSAGCGLLLAGVWYGVLQQMTQAQQSRNNFLREEITKLEGQIKDIATLRADIESLKARQGAVEDLQVNRNVPVHLLDELVRLTPEGIYLSGIKQTDATVQVNGVAQTNERVSEYLRNAQTNSPWLDKMELVEIKAVNLPPAAGTRETRRLFEFALRVTLKQPGNAASAPAGGASGAAPGGKSA
jgi:type IV pilus assembly protein PilN